MNKIFYWKFRNLVKKIVFLAEKLIFRWIEQWRSIRQSRPLFHAVIVEMLIGFVKCGLIALFLYKVDSYVLEHYTIPFDNKTFLNVMLSGLSIVGVILGIYCSNVVTIYSSRYTNAPREISLLYERDFIINNSTKNIITYIILDLILLTEYVLGMAFSVFTMVAITVYTIFVITYYSLTRNRSLQLSNTYNITGQLYNNISSYITRVSAQDVLSKDPSFQNHYQKLCADCVSKLGLIAQFNLESGLKRNTSMVSFMQENILLLGIYWSVKNSIQYNSRWFKEKVHYQQWHKVSDSAVSLALRTGTNVRITSDPDTDWLEEALTSVNSDCLSELCNTGDLKSIYNYLSQLAKVMVHAAKASASKFSLTYMHSVQTEVLPACIKEKKRVNYSTVVSSVLEMIVGIYISIIIGINNYLKEIDLDSILTYANSFSTYNGIEFAKCPFLNTSAAEKMYRCIEMECIVEEKRITPRWFVDQTVSQIIYTKVCDDVRVVDNIANNILPQLGKKLEEEKMFYPALIIYSKMVELNSKVGITNNLLSSLFSELTEKHLEPNIIWEECPLSAFQNRLKETMLLLPKHMMTCAGVYAIEHWKDRDDYPDLLGFCYNNFCEYIISSIEENNIEKFKASYPHFLRVMMLYQEYIREDVIEIKEKFRQSAVFHVWSAPIYEYSMLSGLAIIWGEYIDCDEWELTVQKSLKSFMDENDGQNIDVLDRWCKIIVARRHDIIGIGNRDVINTEWEMRISNAIREKAEFEYNDFGFGKILKTKSTLLKCYCRGSFELLGLKDAEDVFFIRCVNQYLPDDKKYYTSSGWEKNYETTI